MARRTAPTELSLGRKPHAPAAAARPITSTDGVRGEDEHPGAQPELDDLLRRRDPVAVRQVDVHQHDIGRLAANRVQGRDDRGRLPHGDHVGLGVDGDLDRARERQVVIDDEHPRQALGGSAGADQVPASMRRRPSPDPPEPSRPPDGPTSPPSQARPGHQAQHAPGATRAGSVDAARHVL